MQKQELGLEIGQRIWFKRQEKNIYQEAVIKSFREGDLDLLVSWYHGFGLQARRKIFVYEILWTIPLDNVPWPGNFPSAPEPLDTSVLTQKNQEEGLFIAKKMEKIFKFFVSFANNWKTFCFILSQIVFTKEIFNNYHSTQFIECVENIFSKDCQNKTTLWKSLLKAIEFTWSERFKLIMGTFGKGLNAFTVETLKGIHYFQLNHLCLILIQILCFWVLIYKILRIIIRFILTVILKKFFLKYFI